MILGAPKARVIEAWGHPEKVNTEGFEDVYVYERFQVSIAFGFGDTVTRVRTWHACMRTREGVRIGSPRSFVHAIYGKPQKSDVSKFMTDLYFKFRMFPNVGSEYRDMYEDYYYTRGISFISQQRMRFVGGQTVEVPLDVEPLVTHITVERPK